MTLEVLIILFVRVVGSLPVLRWAFVGAIIAVLIDFSDLFLMNLIDLGGVPNYQAFDKWADLVYMATFLAVALRWHGVVRKIAICLFFFRIIGILAFEVIGWRGVLLFFPNLFEFWVIAIAGFNRYAPSYKFTRTATIALLALLLLLKESQEYVLHWGRWLDQYRAIDVVIYWWQWLQEAL